MDLFSSDEEDIQFSQESDSHDLPDISFSKPSPLLLREDRPMTPPVVPALLSVSTSQSTEITSLTSLEHLSPLKAAGVAQKLKADAKLLQKANDLSKDIICKEEMDRKIEAIKLEGGIVNMAKRLGEIISRSEEEEEEGIPMTPDGQLQPYHLMRGGSGSDGAPFLSIKPPGRILFTKPASFLTELYPPGLDAASAHPLDGLLTQDNPLVLRNAIMTGVLSLSFRDRPCPSAVWAWLFQLMCKSHDTSLCKASFKTLNELVLNGRQRHFVLWCPPVMDIQDALIDLGASRENVLCDLAYRDLDTDCTNDVFVPAPPPQVSHLAPPPQVSHPAPPPQVFHPAPPPQVSHPAPPPQVSHLHLTCLVRFMNTCVQGYSAVPYSLEELHRIILFLVKVSLDPAVCGTVIICHISQCIGTLLESIPEDSWPQSQAQLCAKLEDLSVLHCNQLYIAQVISSLSGRQKQAMRLYVKHCIGRLTGVDLALEDVDFVRNVILCYCRIKSSQYDYSQMFSVLKMLNLYMPPSKMKWASADNKQQFVRVLAHFASQLKDRVSSNVEVAVIKSYLMDIKMELDSQIVPDGPRQQTLPF